MLGPPSTELIAGLEALVIAVFLLTLGYLLVDLVAPRLGLDEVESWGLSLAGLAAYALLAMVVHMASSGWLFAHSSVVRWTTIGLFLLLAIRRMRRTAERRSQHVWIGLGLALASVAIWGSPVARMMPLTATADTQLHNGWIDQLMAGDTTFGAVLTGTVPNYYPWLFHSLGAITTTITPGQTPYHALGPLQLLQVAGGVLALFALGRLLTRRALTGYAAALLGALSGGFGFVMLRGLDVVVDPREGGGAAALRYQGDLLFSRSYNVSLHNLAPPFPRDLAFGLLITFVLMLAIRARTTSAWSEVLAGCCLGLVGLTGGETFIVGAALALAICIFDSERRWLSAMRVLGPALVLYALWLVPVVINYVRLGGFVSITHIIPVSLPAGAILVSWGLVTPLALIALWRLSRHYRSDRMIRLAITFAVVTVILLAVSAVIPELMGDAFDTLGRKHRYWPIVYLAVSLLAALGLTDLLTVLRQRSRALAISALCFTTLVAWASPVVASLALPTHIGRYEGIEAAMHEEEDSVLHVLREFGPGCSVAAPQDIAREVFSFTGFRLVLWTGNWFGPNRARIRWAGIYEHIGSEQERIADNKTLIEGEDPAAWSEAVDRYGVDVVVSPRKYENAPAFRARAAAIAGYEDRDYAVFKISGCGI
ncbi:MAG: hypothetical protein QOG16_395 [Actinomycetota bacterium]|jgi:hypothetical protein|nr:hypothetical protein [Actinomycetota bacterium]